MKRLLSAVLITSVVLVNLSGCSAVKSHADPKKYLADKYGMDEDDITIISEDECRGGGDFTPVWEYTGSNFLCEYTDDNGDTREFAVYYSEKSKGTDKYSDTYLSYDIRENVYQQFLNYFDDSELDNMFLQFGEYITDATISSMDELRDSDQSIHISVVCHDLPSDLWKGFELDPVSQDFDFCVLCVDECEYKKTAEYYENSIVFFGPEFGMWNITEYAASWTNSDGNFNDEVYSEWNVKYYDTIEINDLIVSYIREDNVVITDLGDDKYHVDSDRDTRIDILQKQSNVRACVVRVEATPVLLGSYNNYQGNYGEYYRLNFEVKADSDFYLEEY